MDLKTFVSSKNVGKTTRTVDYDVINEAEKLVGVQFGNQLKEYILTYGFLSYKFAELYGINSNQKMDSDLIKQTLYIHKYFPQTVDYIAIENQGEGDYYMVDKSDNIYEFDSELNELNDKNMKLFDYIINRFSEID